MSVGRILGGSPPAIEATYAQYTGFDPRQSRYGKFAGYKTIRVPVTQIQTLRLYGVWWLPADGKTQFWPRGCPGYSTNAFVDFSRASMSIVLGSELSDDRRPYVAKEYGPDIAWLRLVEITESVHDPIFNGQYRSETLIPCLEVIRYHFGRPLLLRESFNGDILLRPRDFRYNDVFFDGVRFRSRSSPPSKYELREGETQVPAAPEELTSYAYRQLRGIAWSMIAKTQAKLPRTLEAFPPVLGRANVIGRQEREGNARDSRTTFFNIESMSLMG